MSCRALEFDPMALIESSPDGVIVVDEDGAIVLVNTCIETMFGHTRGDLLGRPIESLVPARLRGKHTAHRTRYRADPAARAMGSTLELLGCRRDGSEFPVEISLSPIQSDQGMRFFAAVRDVSDRVAAESQSHAVLHTINAAHDGVFMFQPNSLRFTYVNQGAVNQLGYTRDELLEMSPLHIKPEFTRASFNKLLEPLLTGQQDSLEFTTVHRRKDGIDVPVDIVLDYPPAARSDSPRQLVAMVRDISSRQQIERERDQGLRWLEALADLRSAVISDPPLGEVLTLVCQQARDLTSSNVAAIAEPTIDDHGDDGESVRLDFRYFDGDESRSLPETLEADDALTSVLRGSTLVADRVVHTVPLSRPNQDAVKNFDQWMMLPIEGADITAGLLFVGRRGPNPFDENEISIATSLATEAHNAYSLTDARRTKIQVKVLEDRERLGRDLHDLIIQRIFAAGLRLQSTRGLAQDSIVAERVADTIVQLDETIAELRNAIFRLSTPTSISTADRVTAIIDDATGQLGFRPNLTISGDPETLPAKISAQIEPVLTEALSNICQHANASQVDVTLVVDDRTLTLTVSDDGIGFDPAGSRGDGLNNLHARAIELGGSSSIASTSNLGTTLSWTATFD